MHWHIFSKQTMVNKTKINLKFIKNFVEDSVFILQI